MAHTFDLWDSILLKASPGVAWPVQFIKNQKKKKERQAENIPAWGFADPQDHPSEGCVHNSFCSWNSWPGLGSWGNTVMDGGNVVHQRRGFSP